MAAQTVAPSAPAQTTKKAKTNADPKKPKIAPAYPSYLQMSAEAIAALKERTGSSQLAIAKWIEGKYAGVLPSNFKKQLSLQLKKLSQKGKLVQIKHSYKLSDELKKPVKVVKKVVEKKSVIEAKSKKIVKSPKKVVKKSVVKSGSAVKKSLKPKTLKKTTTGSLNKTVKQVQSEGKKEVKKIIEKKEIKKTVKKAAGTAGAKKAAPAKKASVKPKAPATKKTKPSS